jgi:hypothetical protein
LLDNSALALRSSSVMTKSTRFAALAGLTATLGLAGACGSTTDVLFSGGAGGDDGTGGSGGGAIECVDDIDCIGFVATCETSRCVAGACVPEPSPAGTPCDDGYFCSEGDQCAGGECIPGAPRDCGAPSSCSVGYCNEASKSCAGVAVEDGAPCDEGDPCIQGAACKGGVCGGGTKLDCSGFDGPCSVGLCAADGQCATAPANEGAACPLGGSDPCQGGVCGGGSCNPTPGPDGTPCDDGLYCTSADACVGGACQGGAPVVCPSPGGCFVGQCDEANKACLVVTGNDGAACDDGSVCTSSSTCSAGLCVGGIAANDGGACEDGASCTSGTTCSAGQCSGGVGPTVYFADTFADNAKGWVLGNEWAIGPAEPSVSGVFGDDPATDHTATADDGVAGVVLGGLASTDLHTAYYLESPAFDTSQAGGPVVLSFFRWLLSDYQPYMTNYLEVWNGAQWVLVWNSGPAPEIADNAWVYVEHDLTAYKNPTMRVRFGFSIDSGGAYSVGSWNLDDVLVASQGCP